MRLPGSLRAIAHRFGQAYILRQLRNDVEKQHFRRYNERPIEYRFVFQHMAARCPATILDVGTGNTALPALLRTCGAVVTASDNVTNYWPDGMFNRHWFIEDNDIAKSKLRGSYDLVTCISVLEHIGDHRSAVREMFRLLAPGGHLIVTCPYTETKYVENVYEIGGARGEYSNVPYICRSYSRQQLEQWIADSGATVVVQEFWRIETGQVHALGDWLFPAVQVEREDLHQLTCLLMQKPRG